jgi:hypothetical protein
VATHFNQTSAIWNQHYPFIGMSEHCYQKLQKHPFHINFEISRMEIATGLEVQHDPSEPGVIHCSTPGLGQL